MKARSMAVTGPTGPPVAARSRPAGTGQRRPAPGQPHDGRRRAGSRLAAIRQQCDTAWTVQAADAATNRAVRVNDRAFGPRPGALGLLALGCPASRFNAA